MKQVYNMNSLVSFIALLAIMTSCQKFEGIKYVDKPAINFQQQEIRFSFFMTPGEGDQRTLRLGVVTMGKPSDQERSLSLVQLNEGEEDAAIPGVHYVPFDNEELKKQWVIPAGATRASLPITLIEGPGLDTKTLKLVVGIREGENFYPGVKEQTKVTIMTTAMATQPQLWNNYWRLHFGLSWSTTKMRFMIEVTGYTAWETRVEDTLMLYYMVELCKKSLAEYNATHDEKLNISFDS